MVVAAAKRDDNLIRGLRLDYQECKITSSLEHPIEFFTPKMWANYIRGVIHFYNKPNMYFRVWILPLHSNVPQGLALQLH